MSIASPDATDQNARIRVLCVDDNRDIADTTVDLLRLTGFDARASYDGKEAITEARSFLPNVYLIDLNMPGMDGDELAMRLSEMDELQPVLLVAVTAMSNSESERRIQEAGFQMHLVKPVDPYKLVEVVDELFRHDYTETEKDRSQSAERKTSRSRN